MPELYLILAGKIIKIRKFSWYLPEKLTKFPNFTWFCPKMTEFYIIIARNIFFPNFFFWGGGTCPPCPPPSPTPMQVFTHNKLGLYRILTPSNPESGHFTEIWPIFSGSNSKNPPPSLSVMDPSCLLDCQVCPPTEFGSAPGLRPYAALKWIWITVRIQESEVRNPDSLDYLDLARFEIIKSSATLQ